MSGEQAARKSEAVTGFVCDGKQKLRHEVETQEHSGAPLFVVLFAKMIFQGERVRLGFADRGAFRAYQSGQGPTL